MSEEKSRTLKQNNSLHGTLDAYAEKLNDCGCDYHAFLEKSHERGFNVNWTKENLKQFYDAITLAMYNKTSSQLSTKEIQEAYQVFEREINKRSGVGHAWHSLEQQLLESDNRWWGE